MPVIDTSRLRRVLAHFRIVLRQPNRRYKVSRAAGDARCVAEWTNVFKIRRLAEIYLETDLSTKMVQIDEKPIHVNESGSKGVKTLCTRELPTWHCGPIIPRHGIGSP